LLAFSCQIVPFTLAVVVSAARLIATWPLLVIIHLPLASVIAAVEPAFTTVSLAAGVDTGWPIF
jgi:hypothetical protein